MRPDLVADSIIKRIRKLVSPIRQHNIEDPTLSGRRALLAIWLVFYGLIVLHGLTTFPAQRLVKAWAAPDDVGDGSAATLAVRSSLALSADKLAH